jgi:hypothetical protein
MDVDDNPVLHDRYTNDVPVGSQFFAKHRLDATSLRRKLEQTTTNA